MKLSVMERILTQALIPEKSNFINVKLIRKAREALSFTEDEHAQLNFRSEGEGAEAKTLWNNVALERDIELGETVTGMVVQELKKLNDESKLTSDHISLYEKFVEQGK